VSALGAGGLGARLTAFFVAPAGPTPRARPDAAPAQTGARQAPGRGRIAIRARAVAVLGPAGAGVFAGDLAVALARAARAPAAVVCRHGAASPPALPLPVSPAARRLAARLAAQGLEVEVRGRSAVVALPEDDAAAAAAALRADAAAGDAPVVLALGGPRGAALEALLDEQELCVVTSRPGADATIPALAVAGLRARLPAGGVCAVEVAAGPLGRGVRPARGGPLATVLAALA
jgi:hypothetical protein